MEIFNQIAERKIREAMDRGEFDNLPNRGQKIDFRQDPFIPAELQMGYKLLKNAGMLPEELTLKKDIGTLHQLLDSCSSQTGQQKIRSQLRQKLLLLDILKERNGRSIALQDYLAKVETIKP